MWAIDYKIEKGLANFEMFPSFFFLLVNLNDNEPTILVRQEQKQNSSTQNLQRKRKKKLLHKTFKQHSSFSETKSCKYRKSFIKSPPTPSLLSPFRTPFTEEGSCSN